MSISLSKAQVAFFNHIHGEYAIEADFIPLLGLIGYAVHYHKRTVTFFTHEKAQVPVILHLDKIHDIEMCIESYMFRQRHANILKVGHGASI